ncbi:major facilitator superfamily permease [Streptomyces hygroscopicus subsp. jinggangensis 5008]|nr:major facilitator superfamily permease [Streptomyces hygroscopicus subsp. jinggangensis 5008]AGF66738.1 major facilitator superfamily permease [Streptomyces hygroscopicus subsp. jinggangensis TL01]
MSVTSAPSATATRLPGRLLALLSLTCGVSVANIYFPQALTPLIADDFSISSGSAAFVVTAGQFGYAAGIFLLVPLGDRLPWRRLLAVLLSLTGAGLLIAGTATTPLVLTVASVLVGTTTVVPQIIIPLAAGLVAEHRRGAVTGILLSGLTLGILLARAFGGGLGGWLGWRAPYLLAGALVLILAAVVPSLVPAHRPASAPAYLDLLKAPAELLRTVPELRRSCLYQALVFAGFSAAWTLVPLLMTGPAYHLGTGAVGLVAPVGAGSVLATPFAGRLIDRYGTDRMSLWCLLGALAAPVVLLPASAGGAAGMTALIAGMLVLDVALQSGQVANQTRIFSVRPDARSRLNTAYMTCVFLGGSLGSWAGVTLYRHFGWATALSAVLLVNAVALGRHVLHLTYGRRRRAGTAGP